MQRIKSCKTILFFVSLWVCVCAVLKWPSMCSIVTESHVNFAKNVNAIGMIGCMPSNAKTNCMDFDPFQPFDCSKMLKRQQELSRKTSILKKKPHQLHILAHMHDRFDRSRHACMHEHKSQCYIPKTGRIDMFDAWEWAQCKNWFYCYRKKRIIMSSLPKKNHVSFWLRLCDALYALFVRFCVAAARDRFILFCAHFPFNLK